MAKYYKEWLIYRSIDRFNEVLREVFTTAIPELQLRGKPNNILPDLASYYQREARFQASRGGIRNPAMVICNKLRHEFTNYDAVRDAMTQALEDGELDDCTILAMRAKLVDRVSDVVISMIESIPCAAGTVKVADCSVTKSLLKKANDQYSFKEKTNINSERIFKKC